MTALDQEVATLRVLTFAESTRRTYQSQQSLYLQFCAGLNIAPVPISSCNLGRYIAYLGSKLSYSSVRQYLNVVRIMHLDEGHSNPLANNWYLSSILKGLRRHKGDGVSQKLPITDVILHGILAVLNFNTPFDVCFWAACLVAFFSFFRKSNLLVPSAPQFMCIRCAIQSVRCRSSCPLVENYSIPTEDLAYPPTTYKKLPVLSLFSTFAEYQCSSKTCKPITPV